MARKFLYIFAGLIVLVLVGALTFRLYGAQLMRAAMVPATEFKVQAPPAPTLYADVKMWIARPEIANNPSEWLPKSLRPTPASATDSAAVAAADDGKPSGNAAIFYLHPTSFITVSQSAQWNAALSDQETNDRAALFTRGQASPFSAAGTIWAPRYRQANFGAFLTDKIEGVKALDAAYADVSAAFDEFVARIPKGVPVILVGHSQGALHLSRLLRERIAGTPFAKRVVAAYVIGWPISVTTDLQAMGMPACTAPDQTGCLLSWASFAEPADPAPVIAAYDKTVGFNGTTRAGTPILCTNPLTGMSGGDAPASANLGTLKNEPDFSDGDIVPGGVGARCDERGFLIISDAVDLGPYVLPGNNYHVYDFSLFWANVRADAVRRLTAFSAK
ncbi:MAG: DUF3089 domain-containing protein [Sphingomonadaceae bacterium]